MKSSRIVCICSVPISILIIVGSLAIAATTPTESVRETVNQVLDVLKDEALSQQARKQERRDRISTLIRERFDFEEMARRSLARHWRKRTSEEKKEFVDLFSELLISSYIGKIEDYSDEKVVFDEGKIRGNGRYGVVNTTVVSRDLNIPINYKLIRKSDKWWVYDVVVEGVSFISTYRSQYNNVIMRKSYGELVKMMKEKLNERS